MTERIKLGLLGNNLSKSRAKHLHELLGELHGLDVTYEPMDLLARDEPVSIHSELCRCRDEGFTGVNITHPYKREAFTAVATMDDFPPGLNSVNTVLFKGSEMRAANTDYSGCRRAFTTRFGSDFKPGTVLMLGAGGVGVAIAFALLTLGAAELIVSDIDRSLAETLVDRLRAVQLPARPAGPDLREEMAQVQGLVNATPVGMFHYPGCAFPENGIRSQQWAFDAVYTPENTEFLSICRARGITTLSGFSLFLYQGLDAFAHFTGITADSHEIEQEFLRRYPLE